MTTHALSDFDLYLLSEGSHFRSFEKLGAHVVPGDGTPGTRFAVWAPNAREVAVIGDFNAWDPGALPLERRGHSGIWEGFAPGVGPGALYKYSIAPAQGGRRLDKADPYAFATEAPPRNASKVFDPSGYAWGDAEWLEHRAGRNRLDAPIAIFEVHLGSWMRVPEQVNRWLTYAELAPKLADYAVEMGYTHVELMPVGEHPFDGSWGYQQTGFFAPTARFGTPHDFMTLVDALHRRGLGVILDWVPAHFPHDAHGLAAFDGGPLYEHTDPRTAINPKWDTRAFNYESPAVVNFLISSALYWIETYHVDGLRVDAVEPMLYLDYAREPGQWVPNRHGGRENLEAIAFLQRVNEKVHAEHPGVLTIAEDSSARPKVTHPPQAGGLGFDLKWDLGWVHDTVDAYMTQEPSRRKALHNKLTFRMHYASNENYLLPLSHDEVVHGKGSFLAKMPGDEWQRFANLRLLLGTMYALPGKKLTFMGTEFGQRREWNIAASLDWHLLNDARHAALRRWARDLNTQYRALPSFHVGDCDPAGFSWVSGEDAENSVLSFLRQGTDGDEPLLVVCNFTAAPRHNYRVGAPRAGTWEEILNSDAPLYGGSGQGNMGGVTAAPVPCHGRPLSLNLVLPPLAMIALKGPRPR